jgi:hypothetical protein
VTEQFSDFEQSGGGVDPADQPVREPASLSDDLFALIDDGKTYVEAEIQYQRTRVAFAFDRGRSGAIFAIAAFAVLHLALVALVVGGVIALTPMIGAWGATALVVGLLVAAGVILALAARRRFARLATAYREARR